MRIFALILRVNNCLVLSCLPKLFYVLASYSAPNSAVSIHFLRTTDEWSISSPTPLESSLWSPPSFYSIWTWSSLALLHSNHSEVPLATFFCRTPCFLSTGVLFLSPYFGGYSLVCSWKRVHRQQLFETLNVWNATPPADLTAWMEILRWKLFSSELLRHCFSTSNIIFKTSETFWCLILCP